VKDDYKQIKGNEESMINPRNTNQVDNSILSQQPNIIVEKMNSVIILNLI
jgi:hypothetical protein